MSFTVILPFPPSMNAIWRNFGGKRTIKSKQYREWEKAVDAIKPSGIVKLQGNVIAHYVFGRPDKRRRDVANLEKAPSDTMTRWGVLDDDSQIVDIRLRWGTANEVTAGFVKITISELCDK